VGRCWRELVCRCPSGLQLGCGFLPDLTQGGDHVRADVPLVFEQHRCCVLHRGELARLSVLQVPGSARPRHTVTPIFRDGRAQPIQFLEQVRQFPRHDDPLPATPLIDACSVPSTPSEVDAAYVRLASWRSGFAVRSVAARALPGNLTVMTICGTVPRSLTTNRCETRRSDRHALRAVRNARLC